jgi:hypothetical protein
MLLVKSNLTQAVSLTFDFIFAVLIQVGCIVKTMFISR